MLLLPSILLHAVYGMERCTAVLRDVGYYQYSILHHAPHDVWGVGYRMLMYTYHSVEPPLRIETVGRMYGTMHGML